MVRRRTTATQEARAGGAAGRKARRFLAAAAATALLAPPWVPAAAPEEPPTAAYTEMDVVSGGAVSGVVKVLTEPVMPSDLKMTKDEDTCGRHKPSETILRAADGALKNVVVSFEGIRQGKPINRAAGARLDNFHCQFVPHVVAMAVGQKLEVTNSDPILHNTHALMDGERTVFNLALPVQNQKIPKTIKQAGLMTVKCDAGHIWMTAYVAAFEHPYFAVTDERGAFRIDQIPPGTYKMRAWHEALGTQILDVTVAAGQDLSVTIDKLMR